MKLTEEQGTQIQARLDQLEDEKRALDARIDELQTLLWADWQPLNPPVLPDVAGIPKVLAPTGYTVHEAGNGHKSTTDAEVFGLNPYKTYTTKKVAMIWGGDTKTWCDKMRKGRKSGALPFYAQGRGFYYTGANLIKWRQGLEKGK